MTPFVHYLPRTLQRLLLRNFTVWGILVRPTPEGCDDFLRDIRMMDERELRQLFPEAEIWRERVFGITKIADRGLSVTSWPLVKLLTRRHGQQPAAKVVQERKMGTAANSPLVTSLETKCLT